MLGRPITVEPRASAAACSSLVEVLIFFPTATSSASGSTASRRRGCCRPGLWFHRRQDRLGRQGGDVPFTLPAREFAQQPTQTVDGLDGLTGELSRGGPRASEAPRADGEHVVDVPTRLSAPARQVTRITSKFRDNQPVTGFDNPTVRGESVRTPWLSFPPEPTHPHRFLPAGTHPLREGGACQPLPIAGERCHTFREGTT